MSWPIAGLALNVAGSLFSGSAKSSAAKYNARVAAQNAEIARQQGIAAVEAQQRQAARAIGSAMAAYGASGVSMDSGSPIDVLVDSARMAELDKLTTRYNYELKARGYEADSKLNLMEGRAARTSSLFGALGSIAKYGAEGGFD
jgi:hypothetical protein